MIALLQRVQYAKVDVNETTIAEIGPGILAFLGICQNDSFAIGKRLLQRILNYRVFPDIEDKMNLSLSQTYAGLLLVPQFTLAANTNKGNRPSFSPAAPPAIARPIFEQLSQHAREAHKNTAFGQFSSNMQIHLCNDGPVTFILEATTP